VFLAGTVVAQGPVQSVIASYVQSASRQVASPRGAAIDVMKAELLDANGQSAVSVSPGDTLTLRVTHEVHKSISHFHLIFVLWRSTDGLKLFDGHLRSDDLGLDAPTPGETFTVDFKFRTHLARGQYHIGAFVWDNLSFSGISSLVPAGGFTVQETRTYGLGIIDLDLSCAGVVRTPPASG